jgi:hypothetical protein
MAVAAGMAATLGAIPHALADESRAISQTYRLSPHIAPGQRYAGIRLLGSVELAPATRAGLTLGGLSALAWDADESRLYALSDRGGLFHLRPHFEDGRLARVELLAAFALRDPQNRPLRGRRADAEGLVARHSDNAKTGDTLLAVSFERYPRIVLFTPDGRHVDRLALPEALAEEGRYADGNKALESLTWLPTVGYVTAPERPLKAARDGTISIFALDGSSWRYALLSTPNASLVDLQALPDGRLLSLERGHGLMFLPMVIALRQTRLGVDNTGEELAVRTLAVLDSSQGWSVDNFEGLAHHQGLKLFMVSDDNFSSLQKTLLVYFELTGGDAGGKQGNSPDYELRQQKPD